MTISVGGNPLGAIRVGSQYQLSLTNLVASGALTFQIQVGGAAAIGINTIHGSGDLALQHFTVEVIAIHPVIRMGAGDIALNKPLLVGSTAQIGHPSGTGALPIPIQISGTAIRTVGGVGQFGASGDLLFQLVIDGQGVISQRYITGDGDLMLGEFVIRGIAPGSAVQVIDLEGIFLDQDLEGMFADIELEGVG